jgi:hypothetical protein
MSQEMRSIKGRQKQRKRRKIEAKNPAIVVRALQIIYTKCRELKKSWRDLVTEKIWMAQASPLHCLM